MRCAATWSRLLVIGSARRAVSLRPPERLPRREQAREKGRSGTERREIDGRPVRPEDTQAGAGERATDGRAHAIAADRGREQEQEADEDPAGRRNEPSDDRAGNEPDGPPRRASAERRHATRRPAAYTSRTSGAPRR